MRLKQYLMCEFSYLKTRKDNDPTLTKHGIRAIMLDDIPETYEDLPPVGIIKKYAPWLLKAKLRNAEIIISSKGYPVIMVAGEWLDGVWVKGIFEGAAFHNGTWKDGVFVRGQWFDGKWIKGKWETGIDRNGKIRNTPPNTWSFKNEY